VSEGPLFEPPVAVEALEDVRVLGASLLGVSLLGEPVAVEPMLDAVRVELFWLELVVVLPEVDLPSDPVPLGSSVETSVVSLDEALSVGWSEPRVLEHARLTPSALIPRMVQLNAGKPMVEEVNTLGNGATYGDPLR
jgi:hypothetical protein